MGVIVLITSFDQIGIREMLMGSLVSNSEVYKGFESNWYMDYGNKLCIMIFMSSFMINSADIAKYFWTSLLRCRDRRFRFNLKLDPEDEDCDLPNSKLRV